MFRVTQTVERSLKLAWRHKIFWVLALMVAPIGWNGGGSGDLPDYSPPPQEYHPQEIKDAPLRFYDYENDEPIFLRFYEDEETFNPVRGVSDMVNSEEIGVSESLTATVFSTLLFPFTFTMLAVVVGIVFILFIVLFVKSWAWGAFLLGMDDAINDRQYTLKDLGRYGRKTTREFVKYSLFLTLLGVFVFSLLVSPFLALMFVWESYFLAVIYGLFAFVGLVAAFFVVYWGDTFAVRLIALKGQRFFEGFKNGVQMLFSNLGKVIFLSLANCLVQFVILLVFGVIAVVSVLIAAGSFSLIDTEQILETILGMSGLAIFGLAFVFLMLIVSAYLATYSNFTWSMLFNHIVGNKEEDGV